ncbi:MAG: redox-regulated ATPase YchF [Elusimicrobia bacterium]|nr:redox-regulated ATPase YchF [Elusimicrobiota bacterium]
MKIGMLGLQAAGKKTLFALLTGTTPSSSAPASGLPGVFKVRDSRVDELSKLYSPEKTIYAQTDLLLLPDVEKTEGKAPWLNDVRLLDGLALVIRSFPDETVFHPMGSVDPLRDAQLFISELLFADLLLLEKRKEKLSDELKRSRSAEKEKELELIGRLAKVVETGGGVAGAGLVDSERRLISHYQFLTDKPLVAVVNAAHGSDVSAVEKGLAAFYGGRIKAVACDLKLEGEIAAMTDPAERKEFLEGMGIKEPAVARLTRVLYDAMGLMSFFTTGKDEVRAWTVRKGSTAPQAARAIHTDLEKGFIRAEVMKYGDLIALGSEDAVSKAGKAGLKGKDYVVEEGDILHIRAAN